MKICQIYDYVAPARDSMGAQSSFETLTKGLIALGHDVVMKVDPKSQATPAPMVSEIPDDCDILHFHQWEPHRIKYEDFGKPYVVTIHGGGTPEPQWWHDATRGNPHIICVSKFISDHVGAPAYVWEGSDPNDFIYSEDKEDYFLWIGGTDWGEGKGIFSTIGMAKRLRFELRIAGTGQNKDNIRKIMDLCDDKIKYLGALNGKAKAEAISKARAVILLTRLPDACPVVMGEALMSGTPVIGSTNGSMPEVITKDVGFIVKDDREFAQAIFKARMIKPSICREYAMKHLSPEAMAKKSLMYYENMLKHGDVNG